MGKTARIRDQQAVSALTGGAGFSRGAGVSRRHRGLGRGGAGSSSDVGLSRGCQALQDGFASQRSTVAAECVEAPKLLIILINSSAILTK